MKFTPTPSDLAMFDQQWAAVGAKLDDVINAYLDCLDLTGKAREVSLIALSRFLDDVTSHESCVELLICAIDRLVSSEPKNRNGEPL